MNPLLRELLPYRTEDVRLVEEGVVGLVVVDPVVGFTRRGHLSDPERMVPMVRAVAAEHQALRIALGRRLRTLVFLDTQHPDVPEPPYPPHCVEGTGEEDLDPELAWMADAPDVTLIRKDCINGFVGSIDRKTGRNAYVRWILDHGVRQLLVTGDCTDICVSDLVLTTLSARNHGLLTDVDPDVDRAAYVRAITSFDVAVLPWACATFHAPGHPSDATHHAGLWMMAARGATIASSWSA